MRAENVFNVFILQGNGVERLLVKNPKKHEIDEVDGEDFKYFLLAGRVE